MGVALVTELMPAAGHDPSSPWVPPDLASLFLAMLTRQLELPDPQRGEAKATATEPQPAAPSQGQPIAASMVFANTIPIHQNRPSAPPMTPGHESAAPAPHKITSRDLPTATPPEEAAAPLQQARISVERLGAEPAQAPAPERGPERAGTAPVKLDRGSPELAGVEPAKPVKEREHAERAGITPSKPDKEREHELARAASSPPPAPRHETGPPPAAPGGSRMQSRHGSLHETAGYGYASIPAPNGEEIVLSVRWWGNQITLSALAGVDIVLPVLPNVSCAMARDGYHLEWAGNPMNARAWSGMVAHKIKKLDGEDETCWA